MWSMNFLWSMDENCKHVVTKKKKNTKTCICAGELNFKRGQTWSYHSVLSCFHVILERRATQIQIRAFSSSSLRFKVEKDTFTESALTWHAFTTTCCVVGWMLLGCSSHGLYYCRNICRNLLKLAKCVFLSVFLSFSAWTVSFGKSWLNEFCACFPLLQNKFHWSCAFNWVLMAARWQKMSSKLAS